MYITCPKCETKFVVNREQIGDLGRKVKCSKCANIWHQKLENNIKTEPEPTPSHASTIVTGNGINLPALLPIKMPSFLYGLPVLLIGMIIFMIVTLFPNLFELNSVSNKSSLRVYDLEITKDKDLGKIMVAYKVLNSSDKNTKMPLIRLRLVDKNNKVLKSQIDDYSEIELLPTENINITTEFGDVPAEVKNIEVMLGNKLDFILW